MEVLRARMRVQGFGRREIVLPSAAQLDNPSVMSAAARGIAAAVLTDGVSLDFCGCDGGLPLLHAGVP